MATLGAHFSLPMIDPGKKSSDVDKAKQACHVQNPACVKPINKYAGTQNREYQLMTVNDNVDDSIDKYKICSAD